MKKAASPVKIVTVPHPTLTTPAHEVIHFDAKLRKLIRDMKAALDACVDPIGVGLAAPQIGVSKRIFLMKPTPKSEIRVFINPIIRSSSEPKKLVMTDNPEDESLEGCLSIPRVWGPVERDQYVKLAWKDERGLEHEEEFRGFEAVIVQHEVDHLHGVLFTARSAQQSAPLYEERGGKLYRVKI